MVKIRKVRKERLKPKEKILKYLIENKEPVSIRQTSGAVAIDYKKFSFTSIFYSNRFIS